MKLSDRGSFFLTTALGACAVLFLEGCLGALLGGSIQPSCYADNGWQNPLDALDVTGDGIRAVDDFHVQRNELLFRRVSDPETGLLPNEPVGPPFYDVSGDPKPALSPADLLTMINALEFDTEPPFFIAGPPPGAVTSEGPSSIRFEFQALDGSPVDEVTVGEDFQLAVSVTDPESFGRFAAYMDLLFDTELATVSGAPEFRADDVFVNEGTQTQAGIAGIGSANSTAKQLTIGPIETDPLWFTLPFEATTPGEFSIEGDNQYVLLVGIDEAIAPDFSSGTLTIVPEPATGWLVMATLFCCFRGRQ